MPVPRPIATATLVLSACVMAAGPAAAQGRRSSTAMTCVQTVRLIQAEGALVLGTGGQTYDRFVRDRSFCAATEIARRAFRPTLDDPACLIGYTCYEPSGDDWLGSDY